MRTCVIVNQKAGTSQRFAELLPRLERESQCHLRYTAAPNDATRLARAAVDERFDRIVVAGGDGTIGQVVNGVAPDFDRVQLAVLPLGTGNDLARCLGFGPDNLDEALEAAFAAAARPVDVIRISRDGTSVRYCINAASGGFGGKVAADVQTIDKSRWGPFAYWLTAATKLVELQEFQIKAQLDDEQLDMSVYGFGVANGRYVGGGFPMAPAALLDDGLLDITTIPVLPTMELMAAGINFLLGRHGHDQRVRTFQSRRIALVAEPNMPFSIDGEPLETIETVFEVLPRVLPMVASPRAEGFSSPGRAAQTLPPAAESQ